MKDIIIPTTSAVCLNNVSFYMFNNKMFVITF